MATSNPFDLLGDDDNDDLTVLIAAQQHKFAAAVELANKSSAPAAAAASQPSKPAKLPTKPPPPAQAVRDAKNEAPRGGPRRGGRGYNRGVGRGRFIQESFGSDNTAGIDNVLPSGNRLSEDKESGRPFDRRGIPGSPGGFRGGRRGGFSNAQVEEGERPRRMYDHRSATGSRSEIKREGAGRGNWGTAIEEGAGETFAPQVVTNVESEKQVGEEQSEEKTVVAEKENSAEEPGEKEPEEKQITLEEYEKVLEEKRKALLALKAEERKVIVDKEFESMQLVSKKKDDEDIFIKLGSEKDKRRETAEREERAKKAVSINEFLKPSEGESYYRPGGRGRGRGRGGARGGFGGGGYASNSSKAPSIEDPGQFPSLGAK